MPQSFNQTVRTQFNKGLLTEFSELNFPNEASVDELNCDLFKAGNRTKRFGLALEQGASWVTGDYQPGRLFHTATWENVGGTAGLDYLVVQGGGKLRFFRKGQAPLSDQIVPVNDASPAIYTLNLSAFNAPGGSGASSSKVDVASINGDLIIVSPQINPVRVVRNSDGSFTATEISFRIRDYEWQGDRSEYDEQSATTSPSIARQYDTKNCGWADGGADLGTAALNTWIANRSSYPPLTHPWFSGKDSNGDFSDTEFVKVYAGTSLTGNGHYILDLFERDRDTASGLTGIPTEVISGRFNTVASYAGRAWYAGFDSRVYYSQILENNIQLGELHRVNDPTSEYSSDALDTDGGYIHLPESSGIRKLHPFGSSLLVFADNGVWRISGIDGNLFKSTDFSVYKITDFGLAFRTSLVSGQNSVPFWWSYTGIHTVEVTQDGGIREVNISRDTIQTFFEDIGGTARSFVTGEYDAFNNRILWLYPNEGEATEYKFNNVLLLDVDLGAFFPWKITDDDPTMYVCGTSFFNGSGSDTLTFDVIDSNGDFVLDSLGNQVQVTREAGSVRSSEVYFLVRRTDGSSDQVSFALFEGGNYLDWGTQDYSAYAESAYNFVGDLGRRKNSPFITVYMRQTEDGFTDNGDGTYTAIDESSLQVSAFWDFKKIPSTTAQEAYRHKQPIVVDPADLTDFDTPTTVLVTRLKLRGRGRVVRLRFEGQQGKGFNLLGWETIDARNSGY